MPSRARKVSSASSGGLTPVAGAAAAALILSTLHASCTRSSEAPAPPPALSIAFTPLVNGAPFACGQRYENVGTSNSTAEPKDFRLYVSDIELLGTRGERWPFRLRPDGLWQDETVALLDFEDATGRCTSGTAATHTAVLGDAEVNGVVQGIAFRIGLPEAKNHLDLRTAKPPLSMPEFWWSWKDGYTFLRVSVWTPANDSWSLWVGDAPYVCPPSDASDAATCANDPRPGVVLDNFSPDRDAVALDIGSLFAATDLNFQPPPRSTEVAASCFMDLHANDCTPVLAALGIDWPQRTAPDPLKQTFARTALRGP